VDGNAQKANDDPFRLRRRQTRPPAGGAGGHAGPPSSLSKKTHMEASDALALALALASEVSEKLLSLMKMGAPDEAATAVVGILVGLLRADATHGTVITEDATAAIRMLANRGTHGDTIREAGGIPLLLRVVRDSASGEGAGDEDGVEHAAGALAHLVMQRAANRDALVAAGGVPLVARLLHTESQAAQYAAGILGAMCYSGDATTVAAVREGLQSLDEAVLERHPNLRRTLTALYHPSAAAAPPAAAHAAALTGAVAAIKCALGWLAGLLSLLLPSALCAAGREWLARRHRARLDGASDAPEVLVCPITHDVMDEPVVASDGMTYERRAIREVFARSRRCTCVSACA